MATKRNDDNERIRNEAAIQSASLTTTGTAMLLGLLAAAEASQKQSASATPPAATGDKHTVLPDEVTAATQSSTASHHDTTANVIPHADGDAATASHAIQPAQPHVTAQAPQIEDAGDIAKAAPAAHGGGTMNSEAHATDASLPASGSSASSGTDSAVSSISDFGTNLSDHIQQMIAQALPDPGALASSINDTVGNVTSAVLSVPEGAAHSLVTAAFDAPFTLPEHDVIDTAPLGALPFDLAMPVGMVGQAYAGGHDPHDGAFSAIGIHGF